MVIFNSYVTNYQRVMWWMFNRVYGINVYTYIYIIL